MNLGIADQVRFAFQEQNKRPAYIGLVFGASVPLAAFAFSHFQAPDEPLPRTVARWVFVALCLGFSAPKVYKWGCAAFSTGWAPRLEAAAFALLLEGAMTLADHSVLAHAVVSYAFLAVLVTINALVTACSAASDQRAARAAAREEAREPERKNPDTLSLVPTPEPTATTKRVPVRIRATKRAVSRG